MLSEPPRAYGADLRLWGPRKPVPVGCHVSAARTGIYLRRREPDRLLIIGELINCTRKKVGEAAQKRDAEFFKEIALRQANAGASMLDVNGGLPGQEMEVLPWLVNIVQETDPFPSAWTAPTRLPCAVPSRCASSAP